MRDDQINRMHEANFRRVMLLLKQFEFLETRNRAYEEVLSTRWARIMAIWDPEWLKRAVDNRQKELLAECARKFEAAKTKQLIQPISVLGNGIG